MKEITINCAGMTTPRMLHAALAEALAFPDWYGHNLDALHDLLTAISEETTLTLASFTELDNFSRGFHRVMNDAESANPHLQVIIL